MTLTRFFSIDLRSLALFRIALSSVVIIDISRRFFDAELFYSDAGLVPRRLLFETSANIWRVSAYFMSGTPVFASLLLAATIVFAFAMLVGWRTRIASAACWFLVMSLHARNPFVNSSADQLLRLLLLWSVALPLGARFSVDALKSGRPAPTGAATGAWCAALLLQPCFIYLVGAFVKMGNYEWTHGLAVRCAISIFEMSTPFGTWLACFPTLTALLTHGVLALELLGPPLLFVPHFGVRMAVLAAFLALQAGFGVSLSLWIFPWVATAALIPFLPPEFWDRFFPATRGKELFRPASGWRRIVLQVAGALLIVYSVAWGAARVNPKLNLPDTLRRPGWMLHAEQSWGMFVPPGRFNDWYLVAGKTRRGEYINLFHPKKDVSFEKPDSSRGHFPSPYWKNYLSKLGSRMDRRLARHGADVLRRRWNAAHSEREKIGELRIYRMKQRFHPREGAVSRTLLARSVEREGKR